MKWTAPLLFAVVILFLVVKDLPGAWDAQHRRGQPGTLTITDKSCGRSNCTVFGDYDSRDGRRHLTDVSSDDFSDSEIGDRVPVLFVGDNSKVYAIGSDEVFYAGAVGIACVGLLIWWPIHMRRQRNR